ncbi:MAG: fimbrillin family protein [Parabacteroides sp.]|nr:fimbrillin family protein [Parabacteroides sp.]
MQDTWSVQADQNANDGYQKSDFLYAPEKEITFADRATANLAFCHQTARVVINIIDAEATIANTIQHITIGTNDNLALSGTYTEPVGVNTTGTWDISSGTSGTIIPKEITPNAGYLKSYSALVIPQAMSEKTNKKFLAVTLTDGNTYYYTPENQDADLVAGQQYTYNITVKYGYLVVMVDMPGEWQAQEGAPSNITGCLPQTFTAEEMKPGDYFYRTDDGVGWAYFDGGLRAFYSEGHDIDGDEFHYGYIKEDVLPDPNKGTCIGIIVKVGRDSEGDWKDDCVYLKKGDGVSAPETLDKVTGYVMALNGSERVQWCIDMTTLVGTSDEPVGFYGYSNTEIIKEYAKNNDRNLQTNFPAIYYTTVTHGSIDPAPENTSDWFLPAQGQGNYFFRISEVYSSSIRNTPGNSDFSIDDGTYWSSTQGSDKYISLFNIYGYFYGQTNKCRVRPWLTF